MMLKIGDRLLRFLDKAEAGMFWDGIFKTCLLVTAIAGVVILFLIYRRRGP